MYVLASRTKIADKSLPFFLVIVRSCILPVPSPFLLLLLPWVVSSLTRRVEDVSTVSTGNSASVLTVVAPSSTVSTSNSAFVLTVVVPLSTVSTGSRGNSFDVEVLPTGGDELLTLMGRGFEAICSPETDSEHRVTNSCSIVSTGDSASVLTVVVWFSTVSTDSRVNSFNVELSASAD